MHVNVCEVLLQRESIWQLFFKFLGLMFSILLWYLLMRGFAGERLHEEGLWVTANWPARRGLSEEFIFILIKDKISVFHYGAHLLIPL